MAYFVEVLKYQIFLSVPHATQFKSLNYNLVLGSHQRSPRSVRNGGLKRFLSAHRSAVKVFQLSSDGIIQESNNWSAIVK